MFEFDIAVVIPMAGFSSRFPSKCPKQYFNILGKPLFMFCVEDFYKLEYIKKICLVSDNVNFVESLIKENFKNDEKIVVIQGDNSRHLSIKKGLLELSRDDTLYKIVIVHDGARPVVPEQLLKQLILAASCKGAAGATRPLISTVIKPSVDDGCLETSLERNSFVKSETPQAFLFSIIMEAYQQCSKEELEKGTECLQLVLKYCGVRAKLIPGPDTLWKVTDKKDYYSLAPYMKELTSKICLLSKQETDIIQKLKEVLEGRVARVNSFLLGNDILPAEKTYNIVIYLHCNKFDPENNMHTSDFECLLNVDHQGLVVHVVIHSNPDSINSASVHEILRPAKNFIKHYEKLKKGIVIIHYMSQMQEKRLIDLIVSLMFIDFHTFSGQTLFL